MSVAIKLKTAEIIASCKLERDFAVKIENGIAEIQGIIRSLEQDLSGGQGDVIRNTLTDMSQALKLLQDKTTNIKGKLDRKLSETEALEKDAAVHAQAQEIFDRVKATAQADKN